MKSVLPIIAALVLIASVPAAAQHRGGDPEKHEQRIEKMKSELNLSDEQVEQIKAIHQEYRGKREAVVSKEDKEQLRALRDEEREKIHAVLTPEQAAKAKELREEHREQHNGKGRHRAD